MRIQLTDCGLPPSNAFHAAWSLTAESLLAIGYLNDALAGKSIPNLVNIINPDTHPAVIDKAFLSAHPGFVPDWNLEGGLGTAS